MLIDIQAFIDYIGLGNFLSIIFFLITILSAFYFYFNNFYRLVFTHKRVSNAIKAIEDWTDNKTEFTSRIIFYNNGRKTLTNNKISYLSISAPVIERYNTLKDESHNLAINSESENKLNIEFDHLDSSKYVVIEILHYGLLKINGRISESGEILNTETAQWLYINFAIIISMFLVLFYSIYMNYSQPENELIIPLFITILIYSAIYIVLRFIHRLFFIPDNIALKYLETTNKSDIEFNNDFK